MLDDWAPVDPQRLRAPQDQEECMKFAASHSTPSPASPTLGTSSLSLT